MSLYAITPFAASSTTLLQSRLGSNIDYYFVWQPTRTILGGAIAGNGSTKPGIATGDSKGSEKYSSLDMVISGTVESQVQHRCIPVGYMGFGNAKNITTTKQSSWMLPPNFED